MNQFYVTIIHRPEMVPEYIQKEAEQGKKEDLARSAVFDGPGSYYGTHPQNILRGMVYAGHDLPYFKNIVDQYRSIARDRYGYALR